MIFQDCNKAAKVRKSSTETSTKLSYRQPLIFAITALAIISCWKVCSTSFSSDKPSKDFRPMALTKDRLQENCKTSCEAKGISKTNETSMHSLDELFRKIESTKRLVVDDLKIKYGVQGFNSIFMNNIQGSFVPPNMNGPSIYRFRRKLQVKVLEVVRASHRENLFSDGSCDCDIFANQKESRSRNLHTVSTKNIFSRFVWSTSGHSSAAGHGNLHNESYTAFMEGIVKPVFEATGIEFEARNYAMGGMASAPQTALCMESIYGVDADVLSWDFGMTDGKDIEKKAVFGNRVGIHRNRPALMDMNIFGKVRPERITELKKLENDGLTVLHIQENLDATLLQEIPDMFGLSQEQINAIPEYIRHMKCNSAIEKGEPTCSEEKYNPLCPNRKHKASWHPGWRVNALFGHVMGLFLIENLIQAVKGLTLLQNVNKDITLKLQELKDDEDKDYQKFFQSNLDHERMKKFFDTNSSHSLDSKIFYRERNICRTSLLPSESRYKGIMTNGPRNAGKLDYEKGTSRAILDKNPAQDYFYANENDGWTSLVFPNEMEIKEYGPWSPKGILVVCFGFCAWNKCPKGDRSLVALNEKLLNIKVNELSVSHLWHLSDNDECGVAQHVGGFEFPRNNDDQFKLSVKVLPSNEKEMAFTRITSIIAF